MYRGGVYFTAKARVVREGALMDATLQDLTPMFLLLKGQQAA